MDAKSFEYNDKLDIHYRKVSNSLVVSGMGIIFFGLWSVIKVFTEIAFGQVNITEFLMSGLENTPRMRFLMFAVFAGVILFVIIFHYYVGSCAIRVGTGKKRHYLYIAFAIILLAVNIVGMEQYFSADPAYSQIDVTIASFLVDLANCATLINLVITSFLYYGLKKSAMEE
ncbi:MAG: hypothetical protein E7307_09300 [Butyrivibrio sp.]|nr:hypothetical protein [Butyrivibrio sp.]